MSLRVIVELTDAKGTSITINDRSLDEVLDEFHQAWAEKRFMDVGMNRPGYTHKVNPQQVAFIHTLDY